eukprot:jgi/Chrzof1/4209/Cz14g03060.t1
MSDFPPQKRQLRARRCQSSAGHNRPAAVPVTGISDVRLAAATPLEDSERGSRQTRQQQTANQHWSWPTEDKHGGATLQGQHRPPNSTAQQRPSDLHRSAAGALGSSKLNVLVNNSNAVFSANTKGDGQGKAARSPWQDTPSQQQNPSHPTSSPWRWPSSEPTACEPVPRQPRQYSATGATPAKPQVPAPTEPVEHTCSSLKQQQSVSWWGSLFGSHKQGSRPHQQTTLQHKAKRPTQQPQHVSNQQQQLSQQQQQMSTWRTALFGSKQHGRASGQSANAPAMLGSTRAQMPTQTQQLRTEPVGQIGQSQQWGYKTNQQSTSKQPGVLQALTQHNLQQRWSWPTPDELPAKHTGAAHHHQSQLSPSSSSTAWQLMRTSAAYVTNAVTGMAGAAYTTGTVVGKIATATADRATKVTAQSGAADAPIAAVVPHIPCTAAARAATANFASLYTDIRQASHASYADTLVPAANLLWQAGCAVTVAGISFTRDVLLPLAGVLFVVLGAVIRKIIWLFRLMGRQRQSNLTPQVNNTTGAGMQHQQNVNIAMGQACSSRPAAAVHTPTARDPPSIFLCPLTHDVMQDPVVAADGFTYEKEAITQWLGMGRHKSPMTNKRMLTQLLPNHSLRSSIMEWQQQQQHGAGR